MSDALSSDKTHFIGATGEEESWALMYNIYADKLLGTNLLSEAVCSLPIYVGSDLIFFPASAQSDALLRDSHTCVIRSSSGCNSAEITIATLYGLPIDSSDLGITSMGS